MLWVNKIVLIVALSMFQNFENKFREKKIRFLVKKINSIKTREREKKGLSFERERERERKKNCYSISIFIPILDF